MVKLSMYKNYYCGCIAGLLALAVLTGCQAFHKDIRMTTLSSEEQQQVNALLNNAPTRCLGTYLINLPAEFKASKDGGVDYKYGHHITIYTNQQYLPAFKQMIARREQELKNTKIVKAINGNFLKQVHAMRTNNSDKMQGIIFERMLSSGLHDVDRILEGYRWQNNVTVKIQMEATNGSDKRYDADRKKYPDLFNNNVTEKLAEMHQLFQRIVARDDLTIPTTPGFCMVNGFMQGEDREWKDLDFYYAHNTIDDFEFYITTNDFVGDYALLDKPDAYVTQGLGHIIYKGTRESNGLKLEESIAKGYFFLDENGRESEDDEGYVFVLGINMTDPTYKMPQLQIRMYYKIPNDRDPEYSEDQLMVIWREITNSIKIRDSAFESK